MTFLVRSGSGLLANLEALCDLPQVLQHAWFEDLIAWTTQLVLLLRVMFGKHHGSAWNEMPVDYLAWVAEKSDLSDDVKFTANHYRRLR